MTMLSVLLPPSIVLLLRQVSPFPAVLLQVLVQCLVFDLLTFGLVLCSQSTASVLIEIGLSDNRFNDIFSEIGYIFCEYFSRLMHNTIMFTIRYMEPSPTEWMVYRGMQTWKDRLVDVDDIIYEVDSFMSTSEQESIARGFGQYLLKIIVPVGTYCLPVRFHIKEFEWIFAPGLRYQMIRPFQPGLDARGKPNHSAVVRILYDGINDQHSFEPSPTRNHTVDDLEEAIEEQDRDLLVKLLAEVDYLFENEVESLIDYAKRNKCFEAVVEMARYHLIEPLKVYQVLYQCIGDGTMGSVEFHNVYECHRLQRTTKVYRYSMP
eukprot:GILJ01021834.1.p1 GENE.GILJ01021834.1~~GILJ01021834.1.p1  ORF type:complete len:320 (+),score=21.78 GILJ01021834.1:117-1076(+)